VREGRELDLWRASPYIRGHMDKVHIERLPETKDLDGVKRWEEEKGEFAQICYCEEARHIAYFELKKGYWRGKHYHEQKEETFYVISGKIRAVFVDLDTKETEERILVKGDRLRLQPRCGHVFYGIDDSSVVEYSPQIYEKSDAFRLDIG
jgi:dTDP-4-dehydrorhamnose 3,5-epimerase-like enzyme